MPERVNPPLPSRLRRFARQLRQSQTDAERCLWRNLRSARLNGFKFRRQHPIPPYVVDFYCESAKLAVELDGSQHSEAVDLERTRFLRKHGIKVLRFWDNDVLNDTVAVLVAILSTISDPTPAPAFVSMELRSAPPDPGSIQDPTLTPTPLPEGEGLKTQS